MPVTSLIPRALVARLSVVPEQAGRQPTTSQPASALLLAMTDASPHAALFAA